MTFQDNIPEGGTIIPILFGIDETRLTRIGRISCWPIYLSIGNLKKAVRRSYGRHSYVLIGYFPTLEASGRDSDKASFTEAKRVLYHRCMRIILEHLDDATQRQIFLAYLLLLLLSLTIIKNFPICI